MSVVTRFLSEEPRFFVQSGVGSDALSGEHPYGDGP